MRGGGVATYSKAGKDKVMTKAAKNLELGTANAHISKSDAAVWVAVHDHLRETLDRSVKASDFVNYAEGNQGPHVADVRRLLWFGAKSDKELAYVARVSRASYVTRVSFIIVQPKDQNQKPVRIRALLSVVEENGTRGYVSIDEVSRSNTKRRQVIIDAKNDLLTFQRRFNNLHVLFGVPGGRVLDVIAQAIKQLDRLKTG